MKFYKYQGAGNDFLIADNRDGHISVHDGILTDSEGRQMAISDICDRRYGVGADGLMLLELADALQPEGSSAGFRMVYFNSDGSGGMMCGNGGRCILAFAADMGITNFGFDAPDGHHLGEIVSADGRLKIVALQMKDVTQYSYHEGLAGVNVPSDGWFLDTGTRHFVRMVRDVDEYDVVAEGRDIRYGAEEFLPIGVNVNFVEACDGLLKVRTYEKGVEDETFACGTGIVASCIAAYKAGVPPAEVSSGKVSYDVRAKKDCLNVRFVPSEGFNGAVEDVWLTGPAAFVAEIIL